MKKLLLIISFIPVAFINLLAMTASVSILLLNYKILMVDGILPSTILTFKELIGSTDPLVGFAAIINSISLWVCTILAIISLIIIIIIVAICLLQCKLWASALKHVNNDVASEYKQAIILLAIFTIFILLLISLPLYVMYKVTEDILSIIALMTLAFVVITFIICILIIVLALFINSNYRYN